MQANTKQLIADKFGEMVRQRSVDRITVKDLVEACGISRQTFYYHFQDITDVIEWSVRQASERTLRESLAAPTPREALEHFVRDACADRELLIRLLRSQRREEVESMMTESVRNYLRDLFLVKAPKLSGRISIGDMETMLDFCTFGMTGILLKNCMAGEVDAAVIAERLVRLISGKMFALDKSPEV
jgi:AcrR family transcriptional regulator